jgi:hypothetical protein
MVTPVATRAKSDEVIERVCTSVRLVADMVGMKAGPVVTVTAFPAVTCETGP